jgi:hypothetical protein
VPKLVYRLGIKEMLKASQLTCQIQLGACLDEDAKRTRTVQVFFAALIDH